MPTYRTGLARTLLRWGSTPISPKRPDLLSATRLLLLAAICFDALLLLRACIGLAFDAPAHLADPPASFVYTNDGNKVPAEHFIPAFRAALVGTLICCALALPLLLRLLAIVNSARNSDPFTPENGVRLRQTGWLMLAIYAVVTAITYILPPWQMGAVFPISFVVALTVLMIFVLARVFEAGSRMRTELQETI